ncbi:MAG: AraC family transcriptional regulator [Ruminococcaceae bacterium]|nr:AraC family transcriptional regulator [Oscillospiraceae bacterium]
MAKNYRYKYEIVSADDNLPGKVILFDKPGSECYTNKHWHKNIEIDYVLKGKLWVMANNEEMDVADGEYFVINNDDIHQTCGKNPDENVKYLVVLYSYNFIKAYFDDFENYSFNVEKSKEAKAEIKRQLDLIVDCVEEQGDFTDLKITSAMTQILIELFTKCLEERAKTHPEMDNEELEYARKAIDYIKLNFRERITLGEIASHVGLTPTYFSRYFKQNTRKTFKQYLNLVRLEHALRDIQTSGISETRAAVENGFPSVKAFISAFKSVYNCTLSEYIRQYHDIPSISEIRRI